MQEPVWVKETSVLHEVGDLAWGVQDTINSISKIAQNTYECESSMMLELSLAILLGLSIAEIWGEAPGSCREFPGPLGAGAYPKVGTSGILFFEF